MSGFFFFIFSHLKISMLQSEFEQGVYLFRLNDFVFDNVGGVGSVTAYIGESVDSVKCTHTVI